MDKFLKIQNFQVCKEAFINWMWDTYRMRCENDLDPSEGLFDVMRSVRNEVDPNVTTQIKDLNNLALNRLQDVYVTKYRLKKQVQNVVNTDQLDRDSNLYGNRPVASTMLVPQSTVQKDMTNVSQQFDKIISERTPTPPPPTPNLMSPEIENAIPSDVFDRLIDDMKSSYLESSILLQKPKVPDNPKALYEAVPIPVADDDVIRAMFDAKGAPLVSSEKGITESTSLVLKPPVKRDVAYRYLTINGFDRNWLASPLRCQFNLDFADLTTNYRNVASIRATSLIVPNEIMEKKGLLQMPRYQTGAHENGAKLSFPYLSLVIDEISDVCDGFNNTTQNQFAQFVYDNSFRCPNGRGYVILRPIQDEVKTFYPQSLSAISRLTFSIRKPNGTLFNDHKDNYKIFKIEYEQYNTFYIKIVLDKYFDKNEFFVGDTVTIQGYTMYKPATSPPCLTVTHFNQMNAFINRPEGHDVVLLGEANENGFYLSFYVLAPGNFDSTIGKQVVDRCMVDALKEYNIGVAPQVSGALINLSLQNTLSLTLGLDVGDRSILQTLPI